MRVLVVHGSKRGGTEELAQRVGAALVERGHQVDVRSGREVDGIGGYDAVIIGGALYAFRWQRHARSFVRRHAGQLRELPVWMFSSGPLDHTASEGEIPPTKSVARLMRRVGARGHVTFGGRLTSDAEGFVARAMVDQGHGGDFRDMEAAAAWAHGVADELTTLPRSATRPTTGVDRALRRGLLVACWFSGLTALWGGVELMIWPQGGGELLPPLSLLGGTPFSSFFVPGLLLAGVVGVLHVAAALLVARRHRFGAHAAFVAGAGMTVWTVVELLLIRTFHWLHVLYFVLGLVTMAAAAWWGMRRRPLPSSGASLGRPRSPRMVGA